MKVNPPPPQQQQQQQHDWANVPPPGPPPPPAGNEAGESSRTMETVPLDRDRDGEGREGGEGREDETNVRTEEMGLMKRLNPFK